MQALLAAVAATALLGESSGAAAPVAGDRLDPADPAVVALVDAARADASAGSPLDEAIRARLRADPVGTRGVPFLVAGRLEQSTVADGAAEWFVRLPDGEAVLVLVVDEAAVRFAPGVQVRVPARAAGTVEAQARDGERRRYLAFVGVRPQVFAARGGDWRLVAVVAPLVIVLLLLFGAAAVLAARARRAPDRRRLRRGVDDEDDAAPGREGDRAAMPVDESSPLPDDPAQALAELARRGTAPRRADD